MIRRKMLGMFVERTRVPLRFTAAMAAFVLAAAAGGAEITGETHLSSRGGAAFGEVCAWAADGSQLKTRGIALSQLGGEATVDQKGRASRSKVRQIGFAVTDTGSSKAVNDSDGNGIDLDTEAGVESTNGTGKAVLKARGDADPTSHGHLTVISVVRGQGVSYVKGGVNSWNGGRVDALFQSIVEDWN